MIFLKAEAYTGFEEAVFSDAMGSGILGAVMLIYFIFLFLMFAFSMVCYVLQGLGMYTIAERRGIRNGWLAWVPVGNVWLLGSISDQYQYLAKGKIKNKRKVMLGLSIGIFVAYFAMIALLVSAIVADNEILMAVGALLIAIVMMVMAIILMVLQYIALYDLYSSCQPGNAIMYLVLSIFISMTMAFFVFACRKKDLGMPPRKQPAPVVAEEPVAEFCEKTIAEAPAENPAEAPADESASVSEEGFAQPEEFEDA